MHTRSMLSLTILLWLAEAMGGCAYSDALYSHQPGEDVDVVVLRGAQRVRLRVRLGRRG